MAWTAWSMTYGVNMFGMWSMVWMLLGLSCGLNGLAYEPWSECCAVWAMAWMVWHMSYCLNGLGYELWSEYFGSELWSEWFGVWAVLSGLGYDLWSRRIVMNPLTTVVAFVCFDICECQGKVSGWKIYDDLRSGWSLGFLLDKKIVLEDI